MNSSIFNVIKVNFIFLIMLAFLTNAIQAADKVSETNDKKVEEKADTSAIQEGAGAAQEGDNDPVVKELTKIINDNVNSLSTASQSPNLKDIEKFVSEVINVQMSIEEFNYRLLGHYFKTMTDKQKAKYKSIMPGYMVTFSTVLINLYKDNLKIKLLSIYKGNDSIYNIKIAVSSKNKDKNIEVVLRVRLDDKSTPKYVLDNIIISGVNFFSVKSREFQDIIKEKGMDKFLDELSVIFKQ